MKRVELATDGWPKAWKRPLYGPDVVARRLVAAGLALGGPMSSKTVEEAFDKWAADEVRPYGPNEMRIARQAYSAGVDYGAAMERELSDEMARAGAAHGAAEEREAVLAIIDDERLEHSIVDCPKGRTRDCSDCAYQYALVDVENRIRQRGEK